jgi:hypothetical protein
MKDACDTISTDAANAVCDRGNADIFSPIKVIINTILLAVGVVAVIVIIVAGIQMISAQGQPEKVAKARNQILYAIVGLVIAISAFAIVNFVLTNL